MLSWFGGNLYVFMNRHSWNFCDKMDNVVIDKRRKQKRKV